MFYQKQLHFTFGSAGVLLPKALFNTPKISLDFVSFAHLDSLIRFVVGLARQQHDAPFDMLCPPAPLPVREAFG